MTKRHGHSSSTPYSRYKTGRNPRAPLGIRLITLTRGCDGNKASWLTGGVQMGELKEFEVRW